MTPKITDAQRKILYEMVLLGKKPKNGDIKKQYRLPLLEAGLIVTDPPDKQRGALLVPTEKAYAWVVDHLNEPFKSHSVRLNKLWNQLLPDIGRYLHTHGDTFYAVLNPEPTVAEEEPLSPQEKLRDAYLSLTDNQKRVRVKIYDLRVQADMDPHLFNETIIQLFKDDQIALYPEDDGFRLGSQEQNAAVMISDQPKHIVYWE